MTLDERDIQGQDSQEVEVEGCNDHIWWGIGQRNLFDREESLYNKLSFAVYLRDMIVLARSVFETPFENMGVHASYINRYSTILE